jgi:hypothetical protein
LRSGFVDDEFCLKNAPPVGKEKGPWENGNVPTADMLSRKTLLRSNVLPVKRNASSWMFPAISPIAGIREKIRGWDDF